MCLCILGVARPDSGVARWNFWKDGGVWSCSRNFASATRFSRFALDACSPPIDDATSNRYFINNVSSI